MPEGFSSFQVLYSTSTLYLGLNAFSLAPWWHLTAQQQTSALLHNTFRQVFSLSSFLFERDSA